MQRRPTQEDHDFIIRCFAYVREIEPSATKAARKYGVPVSFLLAEALLDSKYGDREIRSANGFTLHQLNLPPRIRKQMDCLYFDYHADTIRVMYAEPSKLSTQFVDFKNDLTKFGHHADHERTEKILKIIDAFGLKRYDEADDHAGPSPSQRRSQRRRRRAK